MGGGNRARVESLEGFRCTIELRPRNLVTGYSVRRQFGAQREGTLIGELLSIQIFIYLTINGDNFIRKFQYNEVRPCGRVDQTGE